MDGYDDDPYLRYRPAFGRSLPVQVMLTGVVVALTGVLFIHLLFTAQYHWPLAPVNYVLQLSAVTTLLISLVATIHVVLSATLAESIRWPYMLSYIAVDVTNHGRWSLAERATWLSMTASTSCLIQITHIQFLTLLYPSKLERRLIFCLLGPLAIVAAVMHLLHISDSPQVNAIASAVRNVCNATLSLLFTAALFVWGFLVNRNHAWRTDGGTAVFAAAALLLAVIGTALNFLYVHKEEEFVWLPTLTWAVVLWQSFLSWWWWVGAGNGSLREEEDEAHQVHDRLTRRQVKRDKRNGKKSDRKKKPHNVLSSLLLSPSSLSGGPSNSSDLNQLQRTRRHRRARSVQSDDDDDDHGEVPPSSTNTTSATTFYSHSSSRRTSLTLTTRDTSSTRATIAPSSPPRRLIPRVVFRWYNNLRTAHNDAARLQAAERVERMRGMARERRGDRTTAVDDDDDDDDDETRSGQHASSSAGAGASGGLGWNGLGLPWSRPTTTTRGAMIRLEKMESRRTYVDHEETVEAAAPQERHRTPSVSHPPPPPTRPNSFWWWGPLGRWRLQDSTSY